MNQGILLPIAVKTIHQTHSHVSADKPLFVVGADGQDYAAKLPLPDNPCLAAAEAVCYLVSAACGIAVPASATLQFDDGRTAFGSRFEGGVSQFSEMPTTERIRALQECAPLIYQMCVVDAFLANPDRHMDNLLFRRSGFDGRWTVLAMDFSRALWRSGFPDVPAQSVFSHGNTATVVGVLRQFNAIDVRINASVAASLQIITAERIADCIAQLPGDLHCQACDELPRWWSSAARLERISSLLELVS